MTCPECGRSVSTRAAVCPHCGAPLSIPNDTNSAQNGASSAPGVSNGATRPAKANSGLVTSEAGGGKVMNLTNVLLLVLIGLVLVVCIVSIILRKSSGATSGDVLPQDSAVAPASTTAPGANPAASVPATSEGSPVTAPATVSEAPTRTLSADDQAAISAVISAWDAGHDPDALDVLLKVYAPNVNFYSRPSTPQYCVNNVRALLDKGYFEQHSEDIMLTPQAGGDVRADFSKITYSYKGERTYPSYLYLRKMGGEWKIIVESDAVTDRNLMKRKR